ncbi:MAG: TIGR02186 family protein [Pseudorhodoplanes sp.]|jgi:uncharacterized protein (TIGR02186 family)|nr:TIGR02186 family protein [Pseudorhodoplanes sp.]
MTRAFAIAALAAVMVSASGIAFAERLISSLSSHQVLVSSSFAGAELVLFGSVERDAATVPRRSGYNLVVTVIGPRQTLVTRRKDRIFGIWANAQSRTFVGAPSYLAVLSNRPLDEIASLGVQQRLDIGMDNVPLPQTAAMQPTDLLFRDALIRLKKERGLYIEEPNSVTFLTPNLFRASIRLPAEAPVGSYEVEVKLFADGTNIARTASALEVVKVGVEQFVANAARDYGFIYGVCTALMALLTGWFASIVFRRD